MNNLFRTDGWVKTTQGPAVPGAQVFVCEQPANVASFPPSPLAPIFSDPGGLIPITQPIITDGFGHYDFYAVPGLYTVVVANGGLIQQVYPDQSVGGVGTGGAGSLVLQTNGVTNTDQLLLNITNTDGALSIASDSAGDVTINNPAIPSGGTTGQVLTKINNTSFNTAWETPVASSPAGSNITTCPVLPDYNTATSGLNGYSIFIKIPAALVQATTTAGVQIGLWTAATTGLVVNSASIGATLPNSVAWTTAQVPITFPAGSFSAASTLYLSNASVITIDTEHDYWIVVYIDPGSTGGSAYADLTNIPAGSEWYLRGHYLNGNYTSQSNASSLQTSIVNNPSSWFSFGQVVVA